MSELTLRPMTDEEYVAFVAFQITGYAAANVEAGNWSQDEALESSRKAYRELLPLGMGTPRMLFRKAENVEGEIVGQIWVGLDRPDSATPSAWIYYIEVSDDHRGKGYGRELLRATEAETLKNGVDTLGLNVFGSNTVARNLYESSGYSVVQVRMTKQLEAEANSQ